MKMIGGGIFCKSPTKLWKHMGIGLEKCWAIDCCHRGEKVQKRVSGFVEREGFQTSSRIHRDDSFRSRRPQQMDGGMRSNSETTDPHHHDLIHTSAQFKKKVPFYVSNMVF